MLPGWLYLKLRILLLWAFSATTSLAPKVLYTDFVRMHCVEYCMHFVTMTLVWSQLYTIVLYVSWIQCWFFVQQNIFYIVELISYMAISYRPFELVISFFTIFLIAYIVNYFLWKMLRNLLLKCQWWVLGLYVEVCIENI